MEIPISAFKKKVQEGTFINCSAKNGILKELRVTKVPKLTKEDIENAKKWTEVVMKNIKWE
jgi:hypothetical protein